MRGGPAAFGGRPTPGQTHLPGDPPAAACVAGPSLLTNERPGLFIPSAEPSTKPVATVLGIGNLIAGDDGLGIHALQELQRRLGVDHHDALSDDAASEEEVFELVDGGVLGLDLLTVVETADRLLVLDAVDAGLAPGAVVELGPDEVAAPRTGRLSVHQIAFNDLIALARLRCRMPRDFVLLGVQPGDTSISAELTPHVLAALPAVVERAMGILDAWRAAS